jgi:exopolysaccharide biosynthesis predicted pyruvyltransferase EpsI/MoaA/NifB/PqqE/SkfB family radical SAM enzyme
LEKVVKFIDCYIETETCNLKCHYCYIALRNKFKNRIIELERSPKEIQSALSKERMGGICLINLCAGGETLLGETILPTVKALLEEGHYVMVVTNGTMTKRFDEIITWDKALLSHLFIKFSFHYLEMIRLNIMDTFIGNVKKIAQSGCSYTVEVTPNDELIPHIDEVKKVCVDNFGAACHVTIARDDRTGGIELLSEHSLPEFYDIWSTFDSKLLDFKYSIFKKKRTEFCHAGMWSYWVDLNTGEYKQCYTGDTLGNIYENCDEKLVECPVGTKCGLAHCYNGHAFLTLGDIPGVDTVTYAETRNRMEGTDNEWLRPEMKAAMSCKLYETNYDGEVFTSYNKDRKVAYLDYYHVIKNKYHMEDDKQNVFIIGTPNHGNMGDQAIWYATQKLLEKYFTNANVVDVDMSDFWTDIEGIAHLIQNQDILILQGGGNFGNYYMDDEMIRRFVINRFRNNRIIMFPQTVYFSKDKEGEEELKQSVSIYNKNKNLILIARDAESFECLKANFTNDMYMLPDVVLSLNAVNAKKERKGALICLRSDKESIMNQQNVEKMKEVIKKAFSEITYTDTQVDDYCKENRELLLMHKLEEFQSAELVITDRLHGMIFSVITGTPCIVFDNFNGKVKNVYVYLKDCCNVQLVHDITEFMEALNEAGGYAGKIYDEQLAIKQFTDVLDNIKNKNLELNDDDIYQKSLDEVLDYFGVRHYQTVTMYNDTNRLIRSYEQQVDNKQKELEVYKDWVNNLQKQNEERMKDTEVYKDWVNNLQKQNEERMKELEVYKDWVNNLQKQIEDMKGN